MREQRIERARQGRAPAGKQGRPAQRQARDEEGQYERRGQQDRLADIGLEQQEAEQRIRDAGFNPVVREDNSSTEPKGTVVDQSPKGDQKVPQETDVNIFVSTYEEPTEEPSPTEDPSPTEPTESPTATESPSALLGGNGRSVTRGRRSPQA